MNDEAVRARRSWGRLVVPAAAVLGAILLARGLGLADFLSLERIGRAREWIDGFGALGPIVFIAGSVLTVVAFVPGLPITLLGGFLFGPLWGTLYVSIASTTGACLAFLIARYGARDLVEQWVARHPALGRMDAAVARYGFRLVMLTRLVPIFPFNAQNYAYGITGIRFGTYALTSWLCMLPATVAFAFAGGALSGGALNVRRTLLYLGAAGALLVLLSFLPRWLGRRTPGLDELSKAR